MRIPRRHELLTPILASLIMSQPGCLPPKTSAHPVSERQITRGAGGRLLTHAGVWSPDGEWILHDTRSDPAGDVFDGNSIVMVHVRTGEVREVYRSKNGAHCGVATFHPRKHQIVFI